MFGDLQDKTNQVQLTDSGPTFHPKKFTLQVISRTLEALETEGVVWGPLPHTGKFHGAQVS